MSACSTVPAPAGRQHRGTNMGTSNAGSGGVITGGQFVQGVSWDTPPAQVESSTEWVPVVILTGIVALILLGTWWAFHDDRSNRRPRGGAGEVGDLVPPFPVSLVLAVWWSMAWRYIVLGGLGGVLVGVLVKLLMSLFGHSDRGEITLTSMTASLLLVFPVQLWSLAQALGGRYRAGVFSVRRSTRIAQPGWSFPPDEPSPTPPPFKETSDPYRVAGEELRLGNTDAATWAKALVQGAGDRLKVEAAYVEHRVFQLRR